MTDLVTKIFQDHINPAIKREEDKEKSYNPTFPSDVTYTPMREQYSYLSDKEFEQHVSLCKTIGEKYVQDKNPESKNVTVQHTGGGWERQGFNVYSNGRLVAYYTLLTYDYKKALRGESVTIRPKFFTTVK